MICEAEITFLWFHFSLPPHPEQNKIKYVFRIVNTAIIILIDVECDQTNQTQCVNTITTKNYFTIVFISFKLNDEIEDNERANRPPATIW